MEIESGTRTISLYGSTQADCLVFFHEDHQEGQEVWDCLSPKTQEQVLLAGIRGITWEHDLSPWDAPAAFKKAPPFTAGAAEYLIELSYILLPKIEIECGKSFSKKYLSGYSLAGLFALYGAIHSDCFDGIVSASGSLWFPGFLEYVKEHTLSERVKKAYFSLGDKEAKTRNPVMATVEDHTREIEELLKARGLTTTFELNPGGHFVDDAKRLAKGIDWMVQE